MKIDCPCCENAIEVTIDPGQKEIHYPTRRAQPALPAQVDEIRGCECWEKHWGDEDYESEVMERVEERAEADHALAIDRKLGAMRDEALMGGPR